MKTDTNELRRLASDLADAGEISATQWNNIRSAADELDRLRGAIADIANYCDVHHTNANDSAPELAKAIREDVLAALAAGGKGEG